MLLSNRNHYNLLDDVFNDAFFSRPFEHTASQIMKTDIHENENHYMIEMELPGYQKEDIKADLKDGYLTISASKNTSKEEKDAKGNCIRKERYTGSCNRSFYVGEQISQEDIKASFRDGVLTLAVPKDVPKAIEEPKLITIE